MNNSTSRAKLVKQIEGHGFKVAWEELPTTPQLIPCAVVASRKTAIFNNNLTATQELDALGFALGHIVQAAGARA